MNPESDSVIKSMLSEFNWLTIDQYSDLYNFAKTLIGTEQGSAIAVICAKAVSFAVQNSLNGPL
jgi:hypothetical protein